MPMFSPDDFDGKGRRDSSFKDKFRNNDNRADDRGSKTRQVDEDDDSLVDAIWAACKIATQQGNAEVADELHRLIGVASGSAAAAATADAAESRRRSRNRRGSGTSLQESKLKTIGQVIDALRVSPTAGMNFRAG